MEIKELNFEEITTIQGGASFAYRAGQVLAVVVDGADGVITTPGAIMALYDWFG